MVASKGSLIIFSFSNWFWIETKYLILASWYVVSVARPPSSDLYTFTGSPGIVIVYFLFTLFLI